MTGADSEARRLGVEAAQALARGDQAAAASSAGRALALKRDEPNANQVLGVIALQGRDYATARIHLERAHAAAPAQPAIVNMLGVVMRHTGDQAAARTLFQRAATMGSADAWRNLGNLEQDEGDADAAITAYEVAARAEPNDARAYAALAQVFEARHDLVRAKASAERALRLSPSDETARVAMARVLVREGELGEASSILAGLINRGTASNRAIAWGLVGDIHDKRGEALNAFAAFRQANQILLTQNRALLEDTSSPYHPDAVRRLEAFAESAEVERWPAPADDAPPPIFLVGFPRSGTTLLDQILSSHSQLICMEEKECLAPVISDLITDDGSLVWTLSDDEIRDRRAAYRARVAAAQRADGRMVIDKLPLNLIFLPLIRLLFPDAKIIFALRDPRDVILSCFQQRFVANAAMVQLLELESAAAYYDGAMRVFAASREPLGLDLHIVRYEDVVADVEGAARDVAAFLGVRYEPAMLAFSETARRRTINTPSARQVVEPLYNRSVGRWRAYAEELAPVLPTLDGWARYFGYDA